MFVFAIARGVNRGWLNDSAYGPAAILGWNAVSTQIDAQGAVQGTCVGTGIGWEATFYAYRPVSPYAAHGYGPVLLAGAEILELLTNLEKKPTTMMAVFTLARHPNGVLSPPGIIICRLLPFN